MTPSSTRFTERLIGAVVFAIGAAAWLVWWRADLVLSHYDAKAHLVVARRVFDNITPGWQQIGAVWLPLPHLLNLLPTSIDFFYRTGLFASLLSITCFAVTAWAAARLVIIHTGSRTGAVVAAALLATNPNLLYLQATPMTEPLLLAVMFLAVLWTSEWILRDDACPSGDGSARSVTLHPANAGAGGARVPQRLGWVLAAAAWTRYEAWPVIALLIAGVAYVSWRRGSRPAAALGRAARLSLWPGGAVLIFLVNSRITVGAWFVTGGFYVPDPGYQHQALRTLVSIWWGTHQLSGYVTETVALLAAAWIVGQGVMHRSAAVRMLPVALFSTAVLPFYAFYQGHPYRIRYMVPVVAACAIFGGLAVGLVSMRPSRRRVADGAAVGLAILLVGSAVLESPIWRTDAPLLQEAQWDAPSAAGRRAVTACLARDYRAGDKVLASMGSLAHYMQELSRVGFNLSDFVNEGNGVIWEAALGAGPAAHVGWMLVEEQAEGGDVLSQRMHRDPGFARRMVRTCEGGGVALYRRE